MLFGKRQLHKLQRGALGGGTIYVVAILFLLVGFGSVLTNGLVPPDKVPTGAAVTIVPPAPDAEKKNLQLYTFGYTTPAPTPTPIPTQPPPPPVAECNHLDEIKTPECGGPCADTESAACDEKPCNSPGAEFGLDRTGKYNCIYQDIPNVDPANRQFLLTIPYLKAQHDLYQQKIADTAHCVGACIAKPIIYLYPKSPIIVDVTLKIPGHVYISDPLYPPTGWHDVLAYPDGSLTYKNKKYHELYYESDVDKVNAPDNGIIIARNNLKQELGEIVSKLGLNENEKKEFLEYWLPELDKQTSPYILFSILSSVEKERVDHVNISPRPDTFIGFIAYFKPLKSRPANLEPLILPANSPERIGFTVVEWGGTIAH